MTIPLAEPQVIVDEVLPTADAFIAALRPSDERWGPEPSLWAFRGHADASWRLAPSLTRGDPLLFIHPKTAAVYGALRPQEASVEVTLILEFLHAADRHGLAVPEDTQRLRALDLFKDEEISFDAWPPPHVVSVMALAQHHGLPTRLLDWSWKPMVAAYFAAKGAGEPDSGSLAVWALRTASVRDWWRVELDEAEASTTPHLEIVTAPQATNPRLAAQAGLFTLHRGRLDASYDLADVISQRVRRLTEMGLGLDLPFLRKISLPVTEAKALLRLLAYEGTSAASVFPGYEGVVDSLRERFRWHPIVDQLRRRRRDAP